MEKSTKHSRGIPSYVPEALGLITHDVMYDLPKERGMATMSELLPCRGEQEARIVAKNKKAAGMKNVRIIPRQSPQARAQ